MKKVIWWFLGVIILFIFAGFSLPFLGRIPQREFKAQRHDKLDGWCKCVLLYIEKNGDMPVTLYEAFKLTKENNTLGLAFVVAHNLDYDISEEEYQNIQKSSEDFKRLVQYDLLVGQHGWFIKEVGPGYVYRKVLMMDQDGKVYEIKEVLKEN